jgi:putative membrane protein
MMLPAAWAVGGNPASLKGLLTSSLALTAWDLLLDPQMVDWGLWVWQEPGAYFGIPLINFLGWFLTGALVTWIARPADLPRRPLLILYTLTWFLESFGLIFFWELPGPGLVGGTLMGMFVYLGWRTHLKGVQHD